MRTLLALLVLTSFAPAPAHAYLTPEEVLQNSDFVTPPPNARGAKAARAAQEAQYDARAAEDAAATDAQAGTETDVAAPDNGTVDDLHGSATDDEVIDWTADTQTAQQRYDERVLQRIERNRLDGAAGGEVILHGSAGDEPLHGGAPLAPTGMGTIAAVLAIAGSVIVTLRLALRA